MRSFRPRRSCVTPVLYLPSRRDISASNIVRFFAQVPPSNSEMLQQWSQWSLFLLVSILVLAVSPLLDTNIDFRYQASSHGARKFIPSVTLAYCHYDVCNPPTVQTIWLIWLFCTTGLWSHWPPRLISRSPDSNNHAPKSEEYNCKPQGPNWSCIREGGVFASVPGFRLLPFNGKAKYWRPSIQLRLWIILRIICIVSCRVSANSWV